MGNCRFPEHHRGGGSGFPWGVAVVAGAVVLVGTSAAFADVMHDVMVMVLGMCVVVTVLGAGGLWVLAGRVTRTDHVPVSSERGRQVPARTVAPVGQSGSIPPPGPHRSALPAGSHRGNLAPSEPVLERGVAKTLPSGEPTPRLLAARLAYGQDATVTVRTLGAGQDVR